MRDWALFLIFASCGLLPMRGDARPADTPEVERIEVEGVEALFRIGPRLYSSGQPEGEAAWEALRALGIKTIISVDGAEPDVEAARRHGMRYIHIPIGYDGPSRLETIRLVQAARLAPGPVLVHCHHGKHRGPAAAALCRMDEGGWTTDLALAWLGRAGTDPAYRGLFEAVHHFTPPTDAERASVGTTFPERQDVPTPVETMVQVDKRWDRLKSAGSSSTARDELATEARLLAELFRELGRQPESRERGRAFLVELDAAATEATALESILARPADAPPDAAPNELRQALATVSRRCVGCHQRYRDNGD